MPVSHAGVLVIGAGPRLLMDAVAGCLYQLSLGDWKA